MKAKGRYSAAFQGEKGAFSHSAALKLLGETVRPVACASFKNVFEALRDDRVTHAVIPIENTLHGSVLENYDHLMEFGFPIRGETSVRISHHLIAMQETHYKQIRQAFSHPVALNQCRRFFERNPRIEPTPFYDTAGSVKMLAEQHPAGAGRVVHAGQRSGEHLQDQAVRGEVVGEGGELGGVPAEAFHLVHGQDDSAMRGVRLDLAGQRQCGLELGADPQAGGDLLGEDLVSTDAVRGERVQL